MTPSSEGAYEFRLLDWNLIAHARSNPITVTATPSVPLTVKGKAMIRTKPGSPPLAVTNANVGVTQRGTPGWIGEPVRTDATGDYAITLPSSAFPGQYTVKAALFFSGFAVTNYHYSDFAQTPVPNPSDPRAPDDDLTPLYRGENPRVDILFPQPVILVHGIWPGGWETWEEGEALLRLDPRDKAKATAPTGWRWQWPGAMGHRGYVAFRIAYDTVYQYLNQSSATMRDWVNAIRALALQNYMDPAAPIDIVAHSKGGLLTRAYLARSDTPEKLVDRVITLGTPHAGAVRLFGCSTPEGRRFSNTSCCSFWPPVCLVGQYPGFRELDPLNVMWTFNVQVAPLTAEAVRGARFRFVGSSRDQSNCEPEPLGGPFGLGPYTWDDEHVSTFSALFPVLPEAGAPGFPTLLPPAELTPAQHLQLHSNAAPHNVLTNVVLRTLENDR